MAHQTPLLLKQEGGIKLQPDWFLTKTHHKSVKVGNPYFTGTIEIHDYHDVSPTHKSTINMNIITSKNHFPPYWHAHCQRTPPPPPPPNPTAATYFLAPKFCGHCGTTRARSFMQALSTCYFATCQFNPTSASTRKSNPQRLQVSVPSFFHFERCKPHR